MDLVLPTAESNSDPSNGAEPLRITKELRFRGLRSLQWKPARVGWSLEAVLELIEGCSFAGT